VPDPQTLRSQDDSAAPSGRFEAHAEHGRAGHGRLDLFDAAVCLLNAHHVDAVHTRLGPALALKAQKTELLDGDKLTAEPLESTFGLVELAPGEVAPDQLDLLLQALLLRLEQVLVALPAFLALLHVGAIVAAIGVYARGAHLPDMGDGFTFRRRQYPVEEVAVVAGNQHSALPCAQRVLQPFHCF